MTRKALLLVTASVAVLSATASSASAHDLAERFWRSLRRKPAMYNVQVGPRPYYLVDDMDDGPLKDRLQSCSEQPQQVKQFSIGHRGAPLQFPEHTAESYEAAARMGAGIIECDVTFTKDKQLVCRHAQCDLHTTTNILAIPELAAKCTEPFSAADPATGKRASAKCCASDITLTEFKSLCGKMDASNPNAKTVAEYLGGTAPWRTDLYSTCGTLLTHAESIDLIDQLGRNFTPELKSPEVPMPFQGTYTQEDYARQLISEYKVRRIHPSRVFAQSFNKNDVLTWLSHDPAFGRQGVYLNDVNNQAQYDAFLADLPVMKRQGIRIVAPPTWVLVTTDGSNRIIPSSYARTAKRLNLDIITWTLERSGPLAKIATNPFYYQSILPAVSNDGDVFELLDVLARQIGVLGVFSDWPGTVTYYANCLGLR